MGRATAGNDTEALAQMNGEYRCPPDAGPAWRAACAFGFDMSLVENALNKTPEQRLDDHQLALDLVLEIRAARRQRLGDAAERESTPSDASSRKA
jgi:hypothetical protein